MRFIRASVLHVGRFVGYPASLFRHHETCADMSNALLTAANRASVPAAVLGTVAFVAVVVFGFGKVPGSWMYDFDWFYSAGHCLHSGLSQYDGPCMRRELAGLVDRKVGGLAYPPNFATVAYLIALGPRVVSAAVFYVLGIVATVALAAAAVRIARRDGVVLHGGLPLASGWLIAIVFGASPVWAAVWMGQFTLLFAVLVWGGIYAAYSERPVLAGLMLGLAAIKPQLVIFVFFWLLLERRWLVVMVAGAVGVAMAAPLFAEFGLAQSFADWSMALKIYGQDQYNVLGSDQVMGIPSLIAAAGFVPPPVWLATLIGLGATAALWIFARAPRPLALTVTFLIVLQMLVFSRQYDFPMLIPALGLIAVTSASGLRHVLFFGIASLLFVLPLQFATAATDFTVLHHFRTALLLGMAVFVVAMLIRRERSARAENSPLRTTLTPIRE